MLNRAAAAAALFLSGAVAMADPCAVPTGADPKLADVDSALRLEYLRAALVQDGQDARTWKWQWVSAYGVLAAGQLLSAPFASTLDQRPGLYVGGAAALVGAVPLLAMPLHVGKDGPVFDSKVKAATPADACALIKEGEELMLHDAHNEAIGGSWIMHVVNVVYNGAVAVILGLGFHNWTSGIISGGVGALVGEAMVFSQPTHLNDAWHTYKSGVISSDTPAPDAKPEAAPAPKASLGPAPGSYMTLSGTF